MKFSLIGLTLLLATVLRAEPTVQLTPLTARLYIVEDTYFARENSLVYLGQDHVTVIGATWTPDTARLLAAEIAKVTPLPVREVIDTNYHTDRAGGNAYWKAAGCSLHATKQTAGLLKTDWPVIVAWTRKAIKDYPELQVCLPTDVHEGNFELQDGQIKALYLGPSHTADGIFVYFPSEETLYGGCILKEQLGNLDFADLKEYPATLRKLQALKLKISHVVAGHGSPLHGADLIQAYLNLLESRPPAKDCCTK